MGTKPDILSVAQPPPHHSRRQDRVINFRLSPFILSSRSFPTHPWIFFSADEEKQRHFACFLPFSNAIQNVFFSPSFYIFFFLFFYCFGGFRFGLPIFFYLFILKTAICQIVGHIWRHVLVKGHWWVWVLLFLLFSLFSCK